MNQKPPPQWAELMRNAGIGDPRNGEPSYTQLAERAGVGVETVRKMCLGLAETSPATVARVAEALRVDVRVVSEMANQFRSVREPYEPPAEAHLLDDSERKAIDQVIRLLAKSKRGEGVGNAEHPAAIEVPRERLWPVPGQGRQAARKRPTRREPDK